MKVVWKYKLDEVDWQMLQMPADAQVLTVQMQSGHLQLWALVDPDRPMRSRSIFIAGTGREIPESISSGYVDSCQILDGKLVYHVFDCGEDCQSYSAEPHRLT